MKIIALFVSSLFICSTFAHAEDTSPVTYEWDLTDLYHSSAAWEVELAHVQTRIENLKTYKGKLGKNASSLRRGLDEIYSTYKETGRVYVYASLSRDVDQRDADAQVRFGKARKTFADFEESISWLNPEILSVGSVKINRFLKKDQELKKFDFILNNILRKAPHTLSRESEAILAQSGLVLSSPQQIYENFANAGIPWPTIELSDGTKAELTQAGYTKWRGTSNRDDRKLVFDAFWDVWNQYANGMGATLAAEVQANVFTAQVRKHDSVLAQNLFDDGLPSEIYTQLVSQVNKALPIFHRYLKLRGKMLGIEDLRYYDIYPPIVDLNTGVFDLNRSKEITFKALAPFGKEYLSILEDSLGKDWMHSHPGPGKRSGAYVQGFAYDVHPYVLLNHNDDYNSLSTFAHEWGHAIHTLLANKNNTFENADYATFIAEMASTINEILLEEYMIANAKTDEERLYYLGSALESIRGTLFRQTMFAEFELAIHETVEKGEPLTGPSLTKIYGELLKRYHGHDEGVLTIDEPYMVEWAYIPHFYGDFYVFQYATSISGAAWFAEQFLAGDEEVRDAFIRVLSAGGSDHPHKILLNEAGLDMSKAESYDPVMRRMTSLLDRIEALM